MNDMSHMGYSSFGRRLPSSPCRCSRGFRLRYYKRFSVQRLRTRFMCMFWALKRLRHRYGQALRSFGRRLCSGRGGSNDTDGCWFRSLKRNSSTRVRLVGDAPRSSSSSITCRMRSFTRSNTFYAEAIADGLEFIKGTYSAPSAEHGHEGNETFRQRMDSDSSSMKF